MMVSSQTTPLSIKKINTHACDLKQNSLYWLKFYAHQNVFEPVQFLFFFVLGYEENTWCIVLKNITSKTTGIEKKIVTSSVHVPDKNVKLGTFPLYM